MLQPLIETQTMADVLQHDLVTADGSQVSPNAETNPGLFRALGGGGGRLGCHLACRGYSSTGTFGVSHRVYSQPCPALETVNTVGGKVSCWYKVSFTQPKTLSIFSYRPTKMVNSYVLPVRG